eukprot:622605-Hanusia_phi.AAC.1
MKAHLMRGGRTGEEVREGGEGRGDAGRGDASGGGAHVCARHRGVYDPSRYAGLADGGGEQETLGDSETLTSYDGSSGKTRRRQTRDEKKC